MPAQSLSESLLPTSRAGRSLLTSTGRSVPASAEGIRRRQQAEARRDAQRRQAAVQQAPPPRVAPRTTAQQAEARQAARRQRLDREQQQRRILAERQRADRHNKTYRSQQRQAAAERTRQLQLQKRAAQDRYEQDYYQRLRERQTRWDARRYNPYNDAYFRTRPTYRYSYDGRYYQTNRFGADLMRQAVNYGYQEGLRAGRADREDGWRSDYRNSFGYRDASYGYYGYYLDQDQYRYYFRQGFRRGYEDGYYGRYRYGRRNDDGTFVVLAAVLAVILGLELLD